MKSWRALPKLGALFCLVGAWWLLLDSSAPAPATVVAARVRPSLEDRPQESVTMTALAQIAEHRAVPPLAEFQAATARPLFAPDRRPAERARSARAEPPPAADHASPEASPASAPVRLVGTVIRGTTGHALIARGERFEQVGPGAVIDGWEVVEIGLDRLVLEREGESRILYILR